MFTKLIVLLVLVVALVLGQDGAINPSAECAMPPKHGCPSQMKEASCVNWNGCVWDAIKPVHEQCHPDPTCHDGHRVLPTVAPVPTKPPTPKPTTQQPTMPPQCSKFNGMSEVCNRTDGCTFVKSTGKCVNK